MVQTEGFVHPSRKSARFAHRMLTAHSPLVAEALAKEKGFVSSLSNPQNLPTQTLQRFQILRFQIIPKFFLPLTSYHLPQPIQLLQLPFQHISAGCIKPCNVS
jgi:hypothetical protein